jgi:hypothetical protein
MNKKPKSPQHETDYILVISADVITGTNEQETKITPTCYEEVCDRDERTKSAKYFRNALLSRS